MVNEAPFRTLQSNVRGVQASVFPDARPRWTWDAREEVLFLYYIRMHPEEDEKFNELDTLLEALDLHGYRGAPDLIAVASLIDRKVKDKITHLRAKVINKTDHNETLRNIFALQRKLMPDPNVPPEDPRTFYRPNSGPGNEFDPEYNARVIDDNRYVEIYDTDN